MNEEEKKDSPLSTDDSPQQSEQLRPPSTDEPIAPAAEKSTDAENPITHNPQLVTIDAMEVHHHAHDPAAPHHKKNWKSYFWEFLMLFLAVFCGFLAEYQLEHIIENQREKKYIASFVEDLKTDRTKIKLLLAASEAQQKSFDTLMGIIKEPSFINNPGKFEKYAYSVFTLLAFYQTDRTLQQLKNSGGLRLIRKQAISDSIMQYDNMIKEIAEQKDDLYASNRGSAAIITEMFDFNTIDSVFIDRSLVPQPEKLIMLDKDPKKLGQLFNGILGFKINSVIYCDMLRDLDKYAERQIIFLKTEYNLK